MLAFSGSSLHSFETLIMSLADLGVTKLYARLALSTALLMATGDFALAERLPIKTYTTADGLPRDYISRIVQDSRGFLWFCTIEGLSRFDGSSFKNYGTEQGLPSRYVNDFLETRTGVYWVATNEGLCRFNPDSSLRAGDTGKDDQKRFVVYAPSNLSAPLVILALLEDDQGTVWCGTGAGVYRLDMINGQWAISPTDIIPATEIVRRIVKDRQGSLWLVAGTGVYRRRPDGAVERYAEAEGLPIRSVHFETMIADRDGVIWVATWNGLYRLIPNPKPNQRAVARVYTTKDGLASDAIFSLFQSSDGRLWAGVGGRLISRAGGLSEFLPHDNGGRFRTYAIANGLSDLDISTISEDRDGNLWLGTETTGAMKLVLSGLTSYDEADGFDKARVRAIFEDSDGKVCAVGKPGAIYRLDADKFTPIKVNLPAGQEYWGWGWNQIILQDHLGEWWISTAKGLVRYGKLSTIEQVEHVRPKAIYTPRDGLSTPEVFRIFEDSRGDIWISTLGNNQRAVTRWDRATATLHPYSSAGGLPESAPTAFCEDGAGNLWIGFYTGDILRYSAGRFTDFTRAAGRPLGLIRSLYLDRANRLWVASDEGGAIRIDHPADDHPAFIRYSIREGLSSNQATCVTEDQWGRIYLGTGRGINRIEVESGNITRYTTDDGLSNSYVYVSFRSRDGALWFGTFSGISRLIPRPDPPAVLPTVLIMGLRVSGIPHPVSELGALELTIPELSAGRNHVQVDFVGFGLGAGETLRYQYKFEGSEWSEPTDQRTVNYPGLSPGSYRFLVRAVAQRGLFSESPAIVSFKILPPIWRRWWFLTIVTALIALTIYVAGRYRLGRLLELERVRTRIATDLHDDIGASLSRMAVLSEVVKRQTEVDHRESFDMLTDIADSARGLVDSMSDIVWSIDPRKDDLRDVFSRIRQFAADVLEAKGIDWEFRSPEEIRAVKLPPERRRHLYLIFKEAINNAARHSECRSVSVEIAFSNDCLVAEITDDGRGFAVHSAEEMLVNGRGGNGLRNMQMRAAEIRGQLDVTSSPGSGTRITLLVPLRGHRS